MNISTNRNNEAMARFLVSRYERVIGEPILASDIWQSGILFEK